MLPSVLSLLHSLPIVSHVVTHTSPTHSASIPIQTDVVSREWMSSQAVCSSSMSSSLRVGPISSKLIEGSSHRFQVKEVDAEFDSAQVVNFQTCWNWPKVKKLPSESMCEYYNAFSSQRITSSSHDPIGWVTFFISKNTSSPHPVVVCDLSVVPESFFWCSSEIACGFSSLGCTHSLIIYTDFYTVKGGV